MKKFVAFFTFLLVLCYCQKDKINDSETKQNLQTFATFEIYGSLAPSDYADGYKPTHDSITKKYGFIMKRVADCEVTDGLVREANRNNEKALEQMNKKYGENWQQKFEQETGLKLSIPLP